MIDSSPSGTRKAWKQGGMGLEKMIDSSFLNARTLWGKGGLVDSILIGVGENGGGCLQVTGSCLNHPGKRLHNSHGCSGFLR